MGFLKSLLGLGGDDAAAKNDDNKSKEFDVLKYDGVRALRMGQNDYAVKCFEHALQIHDDLETCVQEMHELIQAQRHKTSQNQEFIVKMKE